MAPSKSKAKRMAAKEEKSGSSTPVASTSTSPVPQGDDDDEVVHHVRHQKVDVSVTGVLTSRKESKDIKFESFSMNYRGRELISDATLELNFGRRYGLLGANGCGKSTLLACIADRDIPIPEHIDIYLLREEIAPSDRTAVQAVVDSAEEEQARLEKQSERLLIEEGPESEALQDIYDRLEVLDPATFQSRAGALLHGTCAPSRSLSLVVLLTL